MTKKFSAHSSLEPAANIDKTIKNKFFIVGIGNSPKYIWKYLNSLKDQKKQYEEMVRSAKLEQTQNNKEHNKIKRFMDLVYKY